MHSASQRNYAGLSRELVRGLRGRRSQAGMSRRLGYATNAVYTWEAGVAWPTAARFFEFASRAGVRLDAAVKRFFRTVPPGLSGISLSTPSGVHRLLIELRGRTRMTALARASGLSRYTLSRWLHGKAQPKLPELLCYIDHTSLRLLDFLGTLIEPEKLPGVKDEWTRLEAARAIGYEEPFTHAVLRALEVTDYCAARHDGDKLATLLGTSPEMIERCLRQLAASGQIRKRRGRWEPQRLEMVDFRRDAVAAQRVKAYWAKMAAERTMERRPGLFAYNVFAISRSDLARLEDLQRGYLTEMRTIIAQSEPSEVVALANFQLFSLEHPAAKR